MTITKDKEVTKYIPRPIVRVLCSKIHKAKKYEQKGMVDALVKLAEFILAEVKPAPIVTKKTKKGDK